MAAPEKLEAFLGERLHPAQWAGALLLMGGIWGMRRAAA